MTEAQAHPLIHIAELTKALRYCAEMLEMLCPDTNGTPAAEEARRVLAKAIETGLTDASMGDDPRDTSIDVVRERRYGKY